MKFGPIIFITLMFLVLPFVSAIDTEINVRTYPNSRVSIFVTAPGELYQLLNSYHQTSDVNGLTSANYSGSEEKVKIGVKVTKNGQELIFEKFDEDGFATGSPLYLQVIPNMVSANYKEFDEKNALPKEQTNSQAQNITNSTNQTTQAVSPTNEPDVEAAPNAEPEASEENLEEEVDTSQTGTGENSLTGFFALDDKSGNQKNKIIWIALIVIVAGGLFLVTFKFFVPSKNPPAYKPKDYKKTFDLSASAKPAIEQSTSSEIAEAERKIAEAQQEIKKIKNKEKITEMQRKLEEDRVALEKLQRGDGD